MTQTSSTAHTLTQADWEDLLPRLLLYTEQRLSRLSWGGTEDLFESSSSLAQDIVMQSIEQALSGQRQMPTGVSLFHFLRRIIDSNILHRYERFRLLKKVEEQLPVPVPAKTPEEIAETNQLLNEILEQASNSDPKLRQIMELMLEGYTSTEIAKLLETPITDVYHVKKRIRRTLSKLAEAIRIKPKEA